MVAPGYPSGYPHLAGSPWMACDALSRSKRVARCWSRVASSAAGRRVVYAPEFRREIEEPVAGAIAVEPRIPLVITEGNYLLLEVSLGARARAVDEVWFVDTDDELRRDRLVQRHSDTSVSAARRRPRANGWRIPTNPMPG